MLKKIVRTTQAKKRALDVYVTPKIKTENLPVIKIATDY